MHKHIMSSLQTQSHDILMHQASVHKRVIWLRRPCESKRLLPQHRSPLVVFAATVLLLGLLLLLLLLRLLLLRECKTSKKGGGKQDEQEGEAREGQEGVGRGRKKEDKGRGALD